MKKSVIVADLDRKILEQIKSFLKNSDYIISAECTDGFDLIYKFEIMKPDLVLVNTELNLLGGIEAVKKIREKCENSNFIFMGSKNEVGMDEYLKLSLSAYIPKPITKDVLIASLNLAFENSKKINSMASQINSYEKRLTDRKIIEKAKGILMKSKKISEEDAYSELRQASMDMRVQMSIIAQLIVKDGKLKK